VVQRQEPFTGGGLIADVPAQHRLSPSNPTFRGNLLVTEGTTGGTAILPQPSGVLLQDLPFSVELKKFIVEYHDTGMPKLFASDIVIHDHETGEQKPARVEVNHPPAPWHQHLPVQFRRRWFAGETAGPCPDPAHPSVRGRGHHRELHAIEQRRGTDGPGVHRTAGHQRREFLF
jgi:hypothetical protein